MMGIWKKNKLPIEPEDKEWLEDAFLWFEKVLGRNTLLKQPMVLPTKEYFNWNFNGEEKDAHLVLEKVTEIMKADSSRITLDFYSEPTQIELIEGLMTVQGDYQGTSGRYLEYHDGQIEIMLERKQLRNPISLIATIAHEVAHVKLIGEKMIDKNDEFLTEIAVLVYGFGIFNANTSVVRMNSWSGTTHTGWQITGGAGYLHYKVHGFALALYANYRNDLSPEWLQYLEKDVQRSFKVSMNYIRENINEFRFKG